MESPSYHTRKGMLCSPRKKKWVCTTNSNHKLPIYPNLIKELTLDGINQLWVADITYIHILVCFIYLAVILDVYSRKAIVFAISRNIDTQLTLSALRMAIVSRKTCHTYKEAQEVANQLRHLINTGNIVKRSMSGIIFCCPAK